MNNTNYTASPTVMYDVPRESNPTDLVAKASLFVMLLFIFLVPWGDGVYDGLPRVVATISIGFAVLLFLIHGTHQNYTLFHFLIVVYIAWQILSLLWTRDIEWGAKTGTTSIQLILLAFIFTLIINTKDRIKWAYQAYVAGNITGSGIIIYNYMHGIQSFYYGRYGIVNIETDELSVFLALSIPMAAYLATKQKNKLLKFLNLFAIPVIFYAIFLTGTRTGSIVGILGVMYWLFTHRKAPLITKIMVVVIMAASVVTVINFAPKYSVDRIFSSGKSISKGTLNYRSVIWKGTLNQWAKAPIIGTGLGGLGPALSEKYIVFRSAHNTYFHLLAENGIIGLLLYLGILITILYTILLTPIEEKAFLIALLLVLTISQLTTHTHLQKVVWFVLAMLAIHSQMYASVRNTQNKIN